MRWRKPGVMLVILTLLAIISLSGKGGMFSDQTFAQATGNFRADEIELLGRLVAAESGGEPYVGQVAVAAVILNRVKSPSFPNTISGVMYEPRAFESVSNGLVWRVSPWGSPRQAAVAAINGWDPTYGALFFWNPYKPVSRWIWTRQIIVQYGLHVFGR